MAVTPNQLEALVGNPSPNPFLQRVEFALTVIAENISTEAPATARHAQRAALASQVLNNPTEFVPNFAQGIIAQLPLASTNLITVAGVPNADVDTTDTVLQNTISAIWNDYLP